MFSKMKALMLNVVVFLLLIDFHSRSAVCGDKATETTTTSTAALSPKDNPSIPPSDLPSNSTTSNDDSPTTATAKPTHDDSVEITLVKEEKNKASENYKQGKPIVAEIISSILQDSSNNSFVLESLFNPSSDKNSIEPIGEPFNFTEFIEKFRSDDQSVGFKEEKLTNFTNFHASSIPSLETVTFYNNFSCVSPRIEIQLSMLPENTNFKSDYLVCNRNTIMSNGSVIFKQTGARLLYKIANGSTIRGENNLGLLKQHGDIIYANGEVKLTESCENQCELLTNSAHMFNNFKSNIFEKLDHSEISTRIDQFLSTFPFLSICSSSSKAPEDHHYIIKNTVIRKYHTSNLRLGPLILRGFENFVDGKVIAMKSHISGTPNSFILSTQANHIQGQCDWCYFKDHSGDSKANNYSFTFVIEEVKFVVGVNYSESWNLDDVQINLGNIIIHRHDKSCPKILDFTKCILEDFVREAVTQSLRGLFSERFPKPNVTTSTTTEITTKKTETRKIVYWTTPLPENNTERTMPNKDHLPFPTRKVFTPCKDTRKWWQKLFYRNKCADKYKNED